MFDLHILVLSNLVMLAATVVQLSAGLGLAVVGVPLLLLLDPRFVPAPFAAAAVLLLFGQWRADAGAVPRGLFLPSVAGLVVGTAAGMLLAAWEPALASRRGCGVVILMTVALTLAAPPIRPTGAALAAVALISGVMGGVATVHGPLVGIAVSRLPAAAVRGFLGLFWLVAQGTILVMSVPAGRAGWDTPWLALALLPGVAVGAAVSGPARRWLVGPRLRTGILVVATIAGVGLVVAG